METARQNLIPVTVLTAAAFAVVIAGYDVVMTVLAMMRPEGTGRVFGTFLRDGLLILSAVFLLRRAPWALWTLVVLFALTLLRVLAATQWHQIGVNALALAGLILLVLPQTRAWVVPRTRAT